MPQKPKSNRIIAFDLMRGYFLLSITLNHLYYFPNWLDWLTFRGGLFVSSAEGFFFISGIVLGIVRGFKLASEPFKNVIKLLMKRFLQLYVVYVASTIIFTLIGWGFFMDNPGLKNDIMSPETPIWTLIWESMSFQYLYGWLDYLRLYCMFFLASPLAIWLLRKGLWWVVLVSSIALWFVTPLTHWPESLFMQPYKWQLIFFGGLVVGYHWNNLKDFWTNKFSKTWRKIIIAGTVSLAFITLIASIMLSFSQYLPESISQAFHQIHQDLRIHFHKEAMPYTRVLMFLLWFWASFWLFNRFKKPIQKFFGWILIPFGTNSLYVYIMSGIFVFFVHLLIPSGGTLRNFIITISVVAAIWLLVRYRVFMKFLPR